VKVHQKVMVTVLAVDLARRRISLSMKDSPAQARGLAKLPEKEGEKRHESRQKRKSTFTNNPFASALRNKNE